MASSGAKSVSGWVTRSADRVLGVEWCALRTRPHTSPKRERGTNRKPSLALRASVTEDAHAKTKSHDSPIRNTPASNTSHVIAVARKSRHAERPRTPRARVPRQGRADHYRPSRVESHLPTSIDRYRQESGPDRRADGRSTVVSPNRFDDRQPCGASKNRNAHDSRTTTIVIRRKSFAQESSGRRKETGAGDTGKTIRNTSALASSNGIAGARTTAARTDDPPIDSSENRHNASGRIAAAAARAIGIAGNAPGIIEDRTTIVLDRHSGASTCTTRTTRTTRAETGGSVLHRVAK